MAEEIIVGWDAAQAWAEAFTKAQAEFPPILKGQTVDTGSYSYRYADLPSILDAVRPVLKEHGLAVGQAVISEDSRVGVETRIYHTSGHVERFGPVFLHAGSDAKSAGSAVTYARRYSLCAALGIAADEDDDGAAASAPQQAAPTLSHGAWLKDAVQALAKWDDEQKKLAYKTVMEDLKLGEVDSMSTAKAVFEAMHKAYVAEHPPNPDEAPF